jgi:pimeloyl-ACP methyl ester carboxylesterase
MPHLNIQSANIFYEVHGDSGPWVALNAGGRHRSLEMVPLAQKLAAQGFRVITHDRRNTGASDIVIGRDLDDLRSEDEIWADDLNALIQHLGAGPLYSGGSSAGARLSLLLARRHPQAVRGLLLMRITGGAFPAGRLPKVYYGQFIAAVKAGGMAAVCETAPYQERLALNPQSRAHLMALNPQDYLLVMQRWLDQFVAGPMAPVMGVPEDELRAISIPSLVVPGNDKTHSSVSGLACAALIPGSELFELPIQDQDVDIIPFPEWAVHYDALATKFAAFMRANGHR